MPEQVAAAKVKKNPGKPGNFGSGSWTRTNDIRINSPLFYRLNYARITRHIITLKSAQVKDFVKILQKKLSIPEICIFGQKTASCKPRVKRKKQDKNI